MRPLSAEERALWRRVVESVRPLHAGPAAAAVPVEEKAVSRPAPKPRPAPPAPARQAAPGTTLDGTWDRRLARGLVQPDRILDLHGHSLATAYGMLDHRLEQAVAAGNRVLLLITGKPRAGSERRGAIRAAVGDWLAASRHAAEIAAVRNAHPRHGGAGALYIVLRKRRERP
jgi:DNA-nicking Smr family endonuclease